MSWLLCVLVHQSLIPLAKSGWPTYSNWQAVALPTLPIDLLASKPQTVAVAPSIVSLVSVCLFRRCGPKRGPSFPGLLLYKVGSLKKPNFLASGLKVVSAVPIIQHVSSIVDQAMSPLALSSTFNVSMV